MATPKVKKPDINKPAERKTSNLNPANDAPLAKKETVPSVLGGAWEVDAVPSGDLPESLVAESSAASLESLGNRVKRVLGTDSFKIRKGDIVEKFMAVAGRPRSDLDFSALLPVAEFSEVPEEASFDRYFRAPLALGSLTAV